MKTLSEQPQALSFVGRVQPLAALRWNAGAKHRVLAVHGWLDNAMSFAPLAQHLPQCDLVAIDLPGHGKSGHLPSGFWYHFVDYLGDALDAMDALGWERANLLGHSLGGATASTLAAAAPQRVERLLVIEALGPLAGTPGKSAESLRRGLADRRAAADKRKRVIPSVEAAISARLLATPMQPDSARLLVERNLTAVSGGFEWTSDARLRLSTPARIAEMHVQEWLAAIEAQTLLIAAAQHPPYFDPATRDQRVAMLRDARVCILPGQHHLHMDTPEPVAAAIRSFLD
ncbi:MAG: alpha/beta fold hydrolase [Pseudomarimonas sp.]